MSNARNLSDLLGTGTTIATASIADDAITSAKIADDAVVTAAIADDAITSALIATDAVVADGLSSSAIASGDLPTGTVLQVKQAFKKDTGTGGSSSFADVSGLSVSITPSSTSSKILVRFNVAITVYNNTVQVRLQRDSSTIGIGDSAGNRVRSTAGQMQADDDTNHQAPKLVGEVLDSPATTGSVTYKLQYKTQGGVTGYFNRSNSDANNSDWTLRNTSSITVMEIAG